MSSPEPCASLNSPTQEYDIVIRSQDADDQRTSKVEQRFNYSPTAISTQSSGVDHRADLDHAAIGPSDLHRDSSSYCAADPYKALGLPPTIASGTSSGVSNSDVRSSLSSVCA